MKKTDIAPYIALGAGCLALVSVSAGLASAGYRYGVGPFKALNAMYTGRHPGNGGEYDFSKLRRLDASTLDGKNVLFLGASVTKGERSLDWSLPEYFAARTGCRMMKEAVSGTTIADIDDMSLLRRLYTRIPRDAAVDLIVCQLPTNDANRGVPLGEITEAPFDTATVTGAIEEMTAFAKRTWGCRVVFWTSPRFDNSRYDKMVKRLNEIAERTDIGVIDIWNADEFNDITDEQRGLYLADPVHPTKAGYRDWLGPEVEKQLFKLLETEKNIP